jgi:hypothetical protein
MGLYVHLSVVFSCSLNDLVADIAEKHFANLPPEAPDEARMFLAELAHRSGPNPGSKGGLSLWGIVGNYTSPDEFVHSLAPFWEDILADHSYDDVPWYGPSHQEHVIVFFETEQARRAQCYEIGWDNPESENRTMVYKLHEDLPFSWCL